MFFIQVSHVLSLMKQFIFPLFNWRSLVELIMMNEFLKVSNHNSYQSLRFSESLFVPLKLEVKDKLILSQLSFGFYSEDS